MAILNFCVLLVVICFASGSSSLKTEQVQLTSLKFAADIYSQLLEKKTQGNVFFSPLSISLALTMLNEGARANSTSQLRSALGLGLDDEKIRKAFKSVVDKIEVRKGSVSLDIAAKLYFSNSSGFAIQDSFKRTLTDDYDSDVESLNFNSSEDARSHINHWIEQRTHGKIKDLLPNGSINSNTKIVLANAVHFKGSWEQPFDKSHTEKQDFHISPNKIIQVDMMRLFDGLFLTMENEDVYAVDIPYQGEEFWMTVIVPKKRYGLKDIEKTLNETILHEYLWGGRSRERLRLKVPKFQIVSSFGLRKILEEMGIKDVFNPHAANLSGISDKQLFVDEGYHKAFIRVDEDGSEAAAATGAYISLKAFQFYIQGLSHLGAFLVIS
ncbi:unnamed protein product [Notodromas monacha]|uniref:Serpin domain-containing protein n=1 Tax=Notodromas monacha TaxID=399045 RepID=A0A7R9C375_9CRUS|nr:unnamed protein product [Notodromas monacha]CAG0924949.1 unnamed protein product [Notodromas monacha]